eukprot:CAMPEP_0113938752 /NCGR_PEP_ID=MMETSP1339-20121228/5177_1 /TAXON_ID=94617 /ORGANISM="Fibrocapsa japonica" /LENGTH=213 /DNA_ID=CAMNT_0000942013 /DNA_START=93 /DNA_END=734 /DNA_ORIENTATION=+ /assembly_acc=CAM_ASM_000762
MTAFRSSCSVKRAGILYFSIFCLWHEIYAFVPFVPLVQGYGFCSQVVRPEYVLDVRGFRDDVSKHLAGPEACTDGASNNSSLPKAVAEGIEWERNIKNDLLSPGISDIFIQFPGNPLPLARHRVGNGRMFNPSRTYQRAFLNTVYPQLEAANATHAAKTQQAPASKDEGGDDQAEVTSLLPLRGPLEATMFFHMKRPKSHYRTGKARQSVMLI